MSVLPLTIQPDPILHRLSTNVDPAEKLAYYQQLGQDMVETMLANNGIGLAAPQVGLNLNVFVIHKDVAQTKEHLVLCNPTITFTSARLNAMEEGCLSCPKVYREVSRPDKVRVKAYSLAGEKMIFKAKSLLAKVFQHEIDHLNGILILDK